MTTPEHAGPPPRPTPILLTGRIDTMDRRARTLSIGSHTVEILHSVRLDGIGPGDRVVVRGMRDPVSGRLIALGVAPAPAPGRQRGAEDAANTSMRILPLVVGLFVEVCRDVQVLDCQLLAPTDRYALRIELSGVPDRAVLLPRRVLERALEDAAVRRTVRNILQAAVAVLRTQRSMGLVRQALADRGHPARDAWRWPRCIRCEGPILAEDPVFVEAEARGHLACPPAW